MRGQPQRPAETTQRRFVVGQQMRPTQTVELQTVLNRPQEPVRRREVRRILTPHVSTVGQRVEGRQGRDTARARVASPVHELQQLDGELDVTKTTGSELELALRLCGGQGFFD